MSILKYFSANKNRPSDQGQMKVQSLKSNTISSPELGEGEDVKVLVLANM
jgi:hypothetical protein